MSTVDKTYPWHENILDYAEHQIQSSRLPHAVLFRRRPGFFDTTLGWQIVQRLLCDAHSATDNCQQCHLMIERSHPNVYFLDVHNEKVGINEVRQLEQQMWQTAVFNKPKIAFVSGMDLLSISAQNALLKTLEEPPKNVYFILSVDNMSRVLPTIMSRVQRLRHTLIDNDSKEGMLRWLQQTLLAEKNMVTEVEVAKITKIAEYSPEKALGLLRSPEQVTQLEKEKSRFAQFIAGKCSALELVDRMDTTNLLEQLMRYQSYVDNLIHALFEKTIQNTGNEDNAPVVYQCWQGVSLRSLYRLRDSLMTLRNLYDTNVNLSMQLNDYLNRWQCDRTK